MIKFSPENTKHASNNDTVQSEKAIPVLSPVNIKEDPLLRSRMIITKRMSGLKNVSGSTLKLLFMAVPHIIQYLYYES